MVRFRSFVLPSVFAVMLLALPSGAAAATKISQSPTTWKTFWNCETVGARGICLPFIYTYRGLVTVTYTSTYDARSRANVVTIQKVDQSVSMPSAANNGNPCKIGLGIVVDVYENGNRHVASLYGTQNGSYIFSPGTLIYGRVSYPNLRVVNPTFRATARAGSVQCFNTPSQLSWSFGL